VALAAAAAAMLSGCSASNLSTYLADNIPHWAGGLPDNAPPRPGDPRYADYYKAQLAARPNSEAKRLAEANAREQTARIEQAQVAAGHVQRAQSARSVMRKQAPAPQAVEPHEADEQPAQREDAFSLTGRALY
jgi:hypothetical protein